MGGERHEGGARVSLWLELAQTASARNAVAAHAKTLTNSWTDSEIKKIKPPRPETKKVHKKPN